jgi:hypothetical protein
MPIARRDLLALGSVGLAASMGRVQPTNETAYAVYPWLKAAFPTIRQVAHRRG